MDEKTPRKQVVCPRSVNVSALILSITLMFVVSNVEVAATLADSKLEKVRQGSADGQLDLAKKILRDVLPEHSDLQLVDLREFLEGKDLFDKKAFIFGDFKGTGELDVLVCAVGPWSISSKRQLKSRDAYFVFAKRLRSGSWRQDYVYVSKGTAMPFVIWDKKANVFYLGAFGSDHQPGDVSWDKSAKMYKHLASSDGVE